MPAPPAFHDLVDRLDHPVLVVTAAAGGERSGCLVGFHTECSMDPPRYLVCISRENHTFTVAARSAHLAVHVLDRADTFLARLFGGRTGDEVDKFAACDWQDHHGVPVLGGAAAWFVGRVHERIPLGDHVGHLLEPVEAEVACGAEPMAYGQVRTMPPGHPA
ncbi:flavin reductase family protein [Pseudonocardia kunmingensis]|uniref:Flavin reductase (DIM6/NTAB) family NADH-FMN oxidoreductase RutF n=1 Tax=Pseudonocardia kunmingensis TaxID=630975 RepID=A0A543DXA0_9PSEU|nr:flavin reductase family protein [Pseudonocardia kunmingensis]TQM13955.1 flavin reductase (DIM6/NTAB) family NADH-FMN oxidoreductase RutF [Pseudonocardia kunmingensis]